MNSYRIYFAGALFSSKDLMGNALLARAIHRASNNRYLCMLPQNREQRETTALAIRNQDLLMVAKSDLGLFHFDGTELDSGTVVEYMVAKFLDIPAVIIRSDFRKAGDDDRFPWNLMLSNFPRTEVVTIDAMASFQSPLRRAGLADDLLVDVAEAAVAAAFESADEIAVKVVQGFDRVLEQPPTVSQQSIGDLYKLLAPIVGGGFDRIFGEQDVKACLAARFGNSD